jgi:glutamate 5-kinase
VSVPTADGAPRRERLQGVRRLVVKIGSSVLTTRSHRLNRRLIGQLVRDVVELRQRGVEVAMVTSGAVAAGLGRLGLKSRPESIAELQALAAIGQVLLMNTYKTLFRRHQVAVGQVLLTAGDILDDRRRYLNLENTFGALFAHGVVPIINENDSVAVAELKRQLGENDLLAAYVTNLIRAQLLVILSDVDGLYTGFGARGPEGELLRQVPYGRADLEGMIGRSLTRMGSGGMATKLRAARLLTACGELVVIAHGRKHRLLHLVEGQELGTLFLPSSRPLKSRKRWIAFATQCRGRVVVDRGAEQAIAEQYRSLLPVGVVSCEGGFRAGDMVRVEAESGQELGRGLVRYAEGELRRIFGKSSPEVEQVLGRPALEVIHRDDLVLF